jgi:hypothetical protein
MTIPVSRLELTDYVQSTFEKLWAELGVAGPEIGDIHCVDDWSVKDLLAVRVWWTENVIDWVEAGKRGECPITPADGFRWKDTPRLNAEVVSRSRSASYRSVCNALERGFARVIPVINSLNDRELLEIGVFPWAGNYPISRWISINTARQYTTARTFIRRTIRNSND